MPYCGYCGKLCPTVPGLKRHIDGSRNCKKASHEEFGQYANSIWDDIPLVDEIGHQPIPIEPDAPDFQLELEDDLERADEMFNHDEPEANLRPPPPLRQLDELRPRPEPANVDTLPNDKEVSSNARFIEYFPDEQLAGATWGCGKPLFDALDEEQKRVGSSRFGPFEDEEEWQLAEWLIRNVGQKQTDLFLRLPIVTLFSKPFEYVNDNN